MSEAGQRAGLARGPAVRSKRAAVRRAIAAGEVDVPRLLDGRLPQIEEVALDMTLESLVRSVPGFDVARTVRVCDAAKVSPEARLSTLTIARRAALALVLGKETQ